MQEILPLYYNLKAGIGILPAVLLLFGIVLALLKFWCFHLMMRFVLPSSVKILCWNFDGNYTESVDCFGGIVIFSLLFLLIHEYSRSYHILNRGNLLLRHGHGGGAEGGDAGLALRLGHDVHRFHGGVAGVRAGAAVGVDIYQAGNQVLAADVNHVRTLTGTDMGNLAVLDLHIGFYKPEALVQNEPVFKDHGLFILSCLQL